MHTIECDGRVYTPSKIICVGKNYPEHILEMGGANRPQEPVVFIKPNSALSYAKKEIRVPASFGLLHYEVELSFVVGKKVVNINASNAEPCIAGYAVGIDLTLRDRQKKAKSSGEPWALAKGFDSSAVFGLFKPANLIENPIALDISLKLNGKPKQSSNTSEMIFSPAEILEFTSHFMTIEAGDIFMCGTPSGVGEVRHGDLLNAEISGIPSVEVKVFR